jgi:hypothetical protein
MDATALLGDPGRLRKRMTMERQTKDGEKEQQPYYAQSGPISSCDFCGDHGTLVISQDIRLVKSWSARDFENVSRNQTAIAVPIQRYSSPYRA